MSKTTSATRLIGAVSYRSSRVGRHRDRFENRVRFALLGLLAFIATASPAHAARTTATTVGCSPSSVPVDSPTTCTATMSDIDSGTRTTPTGSMRFSTSGAGSFSSTGICSLRPTYFTGVAKCAVTYTPTAIGTHTITAHYGGDGKHMPSSGSATVIVTSPI